MLFHFVMSCKLGVTLPPACGTAQGGFEDSPWSSHCSPSNQSAAWKADPAVKAPHAGSLPHFMGNSEEKMLSLCPHVPLHCGDSHCFPTTWWGGCRNYSHYYFYHYYYYFLGVWDAGVMGKPAPALSDGYSGFGQFFPSEQRFLCLLRGFSELQTAAVWLWPPLGWFSSC